MKKIILSIVAVILITFLYLKVSTLTHSPATEEQSDFLYKKLKNTKEIQVKQHPKIVDSKTLKIITDKKEIAEWIESLKFESVTPQCACFGLIIIEFIDHNQNTFTVEYKDRCSDIHMRFENPWGVLAIPSKKLKNMINEIN